MAEAAGLGTVEQREIVHWPFVLRMVSVPSTITNPYSLFIRKKRMNPVFWNSTAATDQIAS